MIQTLEELDTKVQTSFSSFRQSSRTSAFSSADRSSTKQMVKDDDENAKAHARDILTLSNHGDDDLLSTCDVTTTEGKLTKEEEQAIGSPNVENPTSVPIRKNYSMSTRGISKERPMGVDGLPVRPSVAPGAVAVAGMGSARVEAARSPSVTVVVGSRSMVAPRAPSPDSYSIQGSLSVSDVASIHSSSYKQTQEREPKSPHNDTHHVELGEPIVAELAPAERDVESRIEAKLQKEMEKRLQEELNQRLQEERQNQIFVEAVELVDPIDDGEAQSSSHQQETKWFGMSRKSCIYLIAILLVAILVGVIVGVVVGKSSSSSSSKKNTNDLPRQNKTTMAPTSPTSAPTMPSRLQILVDMIGSTISSTPTLLTTFGTNQNQALTWLAYNDPANLNLTTTPDYILVERYVMAYLYFSAGGKNWQYQYNYFSMQSICFWNLVNAPPPSVGIICNGTDRVTDLLMGK